MEQNSEKNINFKVKNIIRILSTLLIIIVFCPTLLVSCGGEEMQISAMTAVKGIKRSGQTMVEPHPIMIIMLLIPILIIVITYLKNITESGASGIVLACSVVDFFVWFIFRLKAGRVAKESYCTIKSTIWFYINLFVLLVIIILSLIVLLKVIGFDDDLVAFIKGDDSQKALKQAASSVAAMANTVSVKVQDLANSIEIKADNRDIIGYCQKCGTPIEYGMKFCQSCGEKVPEALINQAEEKKKMETEEKACKEAESVLVKRFCPNCGAQISKSNKFCEFCGAKVI